MDKKIVGIIQARIGSVRFPGKLLRNVRGKSILETVINRVKYSEKIHSICVAIPNTNDNEPIATLCQSLNVDIFRGSEKNVLSRFYYAATYRNADIIVRITPDDLLVDSEIIDELVDVLHSTKSDYVSNTMEPTYPEGLNIEVFTYSALKKAFMEARLLSEQEHVTPYIWKNPSLFKLYNVKHDHDYSHWRWTIDREIDMVFFETLFQQSGFSVETVHYRDVLQFLDKHPEIVAINKDIQRNEGYLKSLKEEIDEQDK